MTHELRVEEIAVATDLVASVSLEPGDQSLGWSRRWESAQPWLQQISAVHSGAGGGEEIKDARDDLLRFYVHLYHLKDALKTEAKTLSLDKKQIEDAASANPDLILLGGLANRTKHHGKGRGPDAPEIVKVTGISDEGGWRLELVVKQGGKELDGIQIAEDAMEAWRRLLLGWDLI